MRRVPILVGAALLVAAGALAVVALGEGDGEPAAAEPLDIRFTYFDGTPGSLADFRGTPLVVNFWASWCPACIAEMPDFERVHAALGGRVAFLGMNTQEVSRSAAEELVERTGVTYTLAQDPDGAIFSRLGGIAMPTSVFIDAEGRVVHTHAGAVFADDLADLIATHLGVG